MRDLRLIYPMLAMVLLTAVVLVRLFRSRVRAVREGKLTNRYFRVYSGEVEPEYSAQHSRHFVNLFEAPTLFYAACLAGLVTQPSSGLILGLAWFYVAARCVHTVVHLGGNRLRPRIAAYFTSWAALLAIWLTLAIDVASRS